MQNKQLIRITEEDLYNIINETVANVLIEEDKIGNGIGKAAGWVRNQIGDFWNGMKGSYQQARTNNPYANRQYGSQAQTTPQQNTTAAAQPQTAPQQNTQPKNPRQGYSKEVNAAYEMGKKARMNVPQNVKQKGTQMFNNVAQLEKDFMDLAPQLYQMGVNTRQVKSHLTALTNVIANFAENKKMDKKTI